MRKITLFAAILFLIFVFNTGTYSQPSYPTEPGEAQLIIADLENFLEAYDRFEPGLDSVAVLNQYYFDRASVGLKEYILKHGLTPEMMVDAILEAPGDYDQIQDFVSNIEKTKIDISRALDKFSEVLPNAMYPPTYLLVGANRGIAQASKFGQLVTLTRVVDDPEKLLLLVIHELSHFQQAMSIGGERYVALYSTPNNMLGLCLREGGAEFLTSLVLNRITQEKSLTYLEENLETLKSKFRDDLNVQDKDYWLWGSINKSEIPNLLGYAMGHKICETYYNRSDDKEKALSDILGITQPEEFLKNSSFYLE